MAIADARKGFGRIPFEYVEIDLKRCANTYGSAPCTAAGAAGSECYNFKRTCQDPLNYVEDTTPLTIRLLPKDMVGVTVGFSGYPCLAKVGFKALELAMGEGLSARERLTIECIDFTQHDRDIDPYCSTRTAAAQGTWFGRMRARAPYFSGSDVRYYKGYIVDGVIDSANFEVRYYVLDQFDPPSGGKVKLIARDCLALGDEKKAKAPALSEGALSAGISASDLSLTLDSGKGIEYRLEENLFAGADDFTDAAWTNSGLVITADDGNDIHGNAVADRLADDSAAASEYISQAASDYSVTEPYVVAVDIEKDAIARATRFPVLRIVHAGSTTETSDIALDTNTGDTDITTSTGATGGVDDYGTHWRLWIKATSNDGSNTSCTASLFPAAGASATWVQSVAATGNVLASRPQIERNSGYSDYIETTTAAVKNGMYILVGDEIISVTSRVGDVLSWPSTVYRGVENTVADSHDAEDAVQWCLDVSGLNVSRALQRIWIFHTSLPPSRIPFTEWEAEKSSKLAPYTIDTGMIVNPEGVLDLTADLCACCLINMWADTSSNSVKLKAMSPYSVDTEIDEQNNILHKSLSVKEMPDKRVNSVWVHFGIINYLEPEKRKSYRKSIVKLGNQNYETDQKKEIHCRWFSAISPATTLAFRMAQMLGDTPIHATFALDSKDGALKEGDPIDLLVDALPDFDGSAKLVEMLITGITPVTMPNGADRLLCTAEPNPQTGRYGLIAPNSGVPAYSTASDYQKNRYMFVGYNGGVFFPDGMSYKQIS